ncbi:MAG TPA: hypothetical protein VGK89_13685 [Candidatus Eisenbacteria bacterium]|jgi:hypothetical protein
MGRIIRNRAMDALAKSVLCFAAIHETVILVHVLRTGDRDALNVFTMLAAERLFPGLGHGAGMLLLSIAFAACVYAAVLTRAGRRRAPGLPEDVDRILAMGAPAFADGHAPGTRGQNGHGPARVDGLGADARGGHRPRPTPWSAALVAIVGVTVHMAALALIERFTASFPSVPDVLLERLPYVDFGVPGELAFALFLVLATIVIVRSRTVTVSAVITQLGLFYAVRGLFLFLHPIGAPADAPSPASRWVIYPFPSHAYFPGGHVGIMTILGLSVRARRWRWVLLSGTALFALGTMLARTHYTVDALAGALLGYAIVTWARRHLDVRVITGRPGRPACRRRVASASRAGARRRLRSFTRPARLAGLFLLLVWVGPVTFAQTDSWQLLRPAAAAASLSDPGQEIPARRALLLEPGTLLKLRLRDGSVLHGRYLGRTLLDSTHYQPRFAARSSAYAPFTLGETLHVSLRDGREWTAPFAGYAELTLLLRSPEGSEYLRVPFEFASEIRRANGDRVDPRALIRAFRDRELPSAEALALGERLSMGSVEDQWAGALRVPVEDIRSASAKLPSGASSPALGIAIGVMVTVVLIVLIVKSADNSCRSGCTSTNTDIPNILSDARLTTRPFDRSRGCFVGDALAVADPWPGSAASTVQLTATAADSPFSD